MGKKKSVDSTRLINAIESGQTSVQIMKDFGIKTSAQLKTLYIDALVNQGKVTGIISRRKKAPQEEAKAINVNKRGSLVIPRESMEQLGYKEGDTFSVRRTRSGLSLKKN